VVGRKDKKSLIGELVRHRTKEQQKPKIQQRAPSRSTLEFDVTDETFIKTKEDLKATE
jgi:hypothetical protein